MVYTPLGTKTVNQLLAEFGSLQSFALLKPEEKNAILIRAIEDASYRLVDLLPDGGDYQVIIETNNPLPPPPNVAYPLPDIMEVKHLVVEGAADNSVLDFPIVKLKWETPMESYGKSTTGMPLFRDGFTGDYHLLTLAQLQSVSKYIVMMYVSNGAIDPNQPYPKADRDWYYLTETISSSIDVRLPSMKHIGLWVGFTNSVTTSDIPLIKYNLAE